MQPKKIVISDNGEEQAVTAIDFTKQLAYAMRYADAPLTQAQAATILMYLNARLS